MTSDPPGDEPTTTWLRNGGSILGIKVRGKAYFSVEDFLTAKAGSGPATQLNHGEELGDAYVFPLVGGEVTDLLAVAEQIAALPGVPAGAYAVLTDSQSVGTEGGERLELGRR